MELKYRKLPLHQAAQSTLHRQVRMVTSFLTVILHTAFQEAKSVI